ncbi:Pimeloyl-ACP methyl ester carboxylesterase [Salipiger thiooxidans]|uniref:Pimeloyl-ACP methyl ester carboxylesterase n=1 Tax=Salipiger thiooxidans TaxID=282683 RepID=A0A1G7J0R5_9RHOB|nr:alpha/beta fold hydrolase [Salipiger thiooxidans]SDF18520.1 Pimeloyl-ACP methyl ester carboxylesterase [Salipiger thiooxidans]
MTPLTVETGDGAVLKVRRQGRGAPVVLVSGLGGTAGFWDPVIARLQDRFELITFDQRGIAGSTRGSAPVNIAQLARDVLTICDALELSRAAFLGHSTGGCIVQTIAATAPERVERLALSAAWLKPGNYLTALFEFRLGLLHRDPRAYAESAALLSYAPGWLESHWDKYERATANPPADPGTQAIVAERIRALLDFDGSDQIGAVTAETTIIGAQDDMIVPAFLQQELARHLPGAALRMLPDGGHFYPASRTDAFVAIATDWLDAPLTSERTER